MHEVTSPQAFEGLAIAGRKPWRTGANLAVADHNVPTLNRAQGIDDPVSKLQVDTLDANCDKYGITEFRMNDLRQGIVHVIGPEQGATLPGMTVVCGDSHQHARRAGRAGFRHRHVRGRARAGDADAAHEESQEHADQGRGRVALRLYGQDVVLHIIGIIGTAGGTAMPSNSPAAPSARCPWKAA